jgi:AcrR family transcriptional regulator
MGTAERRQREREQRLREIVDAAERVFAQKGFSGATMEEIAVAAELSPATLYIYFKNKYDLWARLNLSMLQTLVEQVGALAQLPADDPMDKIRGMSDALFRVYEHNPSLLINFLHLQASEGIRDLSPETAEETNELSVAEGGIRD